MSKILNRIVNKIICEDESLRIKDLAVKNKAELWYADLRGADLWYADLRGVNLYGAVIFDKKIITFKQINQIGYNKRQLSCFYLEDEGFCFSAGCFFGSEEELKSKVIEKYGNDCEYLDAIEFLKNLCKKYK
jgi:hypothetical protein